jgi:hypothetical protein
MGVDEAAGEVLDVPKPSWQERSRHAGRAAAHLTQVLAAAEEKRS